VHSSTQGEEGAGEPAPYEPRKIGPPGPGPAPRKRGRRSRWLDRILGIVLGIVVGLGVIVVFVFKGSEGTIDAPRISGVDAGQPGASPGAGLPFGAKVPLVKIVGGAPPASGPVRLDFKQGREARFAVDSDQQLALSIPGYGVSRTVKGGRTFVAFRASKPGQFPVIVTASHIDVATLHVARR
jgi:hypothetical protein